MPKKRLIILITAVILFLLLAAIIGLLILSRQPADARPAVGPTVLITSPVPAENSVASPSIAIQAAVYGDNPIHRLELWMDGELSQTFYNQDPGQTFTLEISFSQLLTAGGHLLFVRAIDTQNLIGQSLPISAEGTLAIVGDGPFSLVQIQPGDTLDETLAANGTDLDAVLPSNPGLNSGASPGTTIAIPIKPEEGAQPNPPSGPPPVPPGNPTFLDLIKLLPISIHGCITSFRGLRMWSVTVSSFFIFGSSICKRMIFQQQIRQLVINDRTLFLFWKGNEKFTIPVQCLN